MTLLAALRIESQSNSAEVDEGESALLTVTAAGGKQPYTYQWFRGSDAISGASAASYSAAQAGTYRCTVTDANGRKVDSAEIQVTVIPKLRFTMQPSGAVIDHGSVASLQVAATGGKGAYAYRWYKDGVLIPAAETETADVGEAGAYYCRVIDERGRTIDSDSVTVTVIMPFRITQQPQNAVIESGAGVKLTVVAEDGREPYSYRWYKDGVAISGAASSAYTATQSGIYYCRASDSIGASDESRKAFVTVGSALHLTHQPEDQVAYADDKYSGNMRVGLDGGTEPYSFQWYKDGEPILGEEARKNCYYAKASGVYCCFVQDSAGKSVLSDEKRACATGSSWKTTPIRRSASSAASARPPTTRTSRAARR